jgi:hypothetical protein
LRRYNIGRDYLVGNLTGTTVPSRNVTNQTTYSGSTTYNNYTYQTDVQYVSGLLQNTSSRSCSSPAGQFQVSAEVSALTHLSDGINHYLTYAKCPYLRSGT